MEVVVKKLLTILMLSLPLLYLAGCEENDDVFIVDSIPADIPPQVPQGVYSITGDGQVTIVWIPIDDINGDFSHYVVYRSNNPTTGYLPIGETTSEVFVDRNVINGNTYYYAVSSIDIDGYLSALSYEDVFDTPRPEGFDQALFDFYTFPDDAGWDLSEAQVVPFDNGNADIYFEFVPVDDAFYINIANDTTDLQDMGYTDNLDEIGWAPEFGWSDNGWAELIPGHTYLIWTDDNHFAKIRVKTIYKDSNPRVFFDWAYQTDLGNPELKPAAKRPAGYLRHPDRTD
jgi:hypothetical protein